MGHLFFLASAAYDDSVAQARLEGMSCTGREGSGRTPAERYTDYSIHKIFSEKEDFNDPLDSIEENSEKIFGSYKQLIKMPEYKYIHPNKSDKRLQSPR